MLAQKDAGDALFKCDRYEGSPAGMGPKTKCDVLHGTPQELSGCGDNST